MNGIAMIPNGPLLLQNRRQVYPNLTMPKTDILERTFSLEGKCALITGSSSGIGRALAVGFAEAGARVAVHGTQQDRPGNIAIEKTPTVRIWSRVDRPPSRSNFRAMSGVS